MQLTRKTSKITYGDIYINKTYGFNKNAKPSNKESNK